MRLCVSQNSKVSFCHSGLGTQSDGKNYIQASLSGFLYRVQFEIKIHSPRGIHDMWKEEFSFVYPNLGKFTLQLVPPGDFKCLIGRLNIKGVTYDIFHKIGKP